MSILEEGFWWLNALACGWSVIYWAVYRGTRRVPLGLLIPGSRQMWLWRLIAATNSRVPDRLAEDFATFIRKKTGSLASKSAGDTARYSMALRTARSPHWT